MSVLLDVFFDFIIDFFVKMTYGKLGHRPWVRITAVVLCICAILAYIIIGAYTSWQDGNEGKLYMYICFLVLFVILLLLVPIRWWWRKRKSSKEN